MAPKLDLEARMTIKTLKERGVTTRSIGDVLGVTEGAVRYHLRRQAAGAVDGRAKQVHLAASYDAAILAWLEGRGADAPLNLTELHRWLVLEHGFDGSLRSLQRYFRARFPKPPRRARRRVETPPGAQGQVDWAEFRGVPFVDRPRDLYAFHVALSYSRFEAIVWSERKDLISWLSCHGKALVRLGGVPATMRVDNEKTAVSRGAGAWGEINPVYRRYAEVARFHIDACAPRSPQAKGKVERKILDHRRCDPRSRVWSDLDELQAWSDKQMIESAHRRCCPTTGTSVFEAWLVERELLGELPMLPEPFDLVATRRVDEDCTVAFDSRRYSVPFRFVGRTVEARGCARSVQILADAQVIAEHERYTERRLVIDNAHFEGEATAEVLPPLPLGRMGKRLQEIAAMVPEARPLDLYAELAEVAR